MKKEIDVLDVMTKSIKKFRSIDHVMSEESLTDSYYRGDICDTEDELQKRFSRKYINSDSSIQSHLDFDFNYEF